VAKRIGKDRIQKNVEKQFHASLEKNSIYGYSLKQGIAIDRQILVTNNELFTFLVKFIYSQRDLYQKFLNYLDTQID